MTAVDQGWLDTASALLEVATRRTIASYGMAVRTPDAPKINRYGGPCNNRTGRITPVPVGPGAPCRLIADIEAWIGEIAKLDGAKTFTVHQWPRCVASVIEGSPGVLWVMHAGVLIDTRP